MTSSPAPAVRAHRTPKLAVTVLVLGIVLMAATAFVNLIDEPLLPLGLLATPVLAGAIAAVLAMRDRRLGEDARRLWAAALVFTGLAAVAVALLLYYYVLPF